MIICQCKAVTDRCVDHAVQTGARTLAQVCRATGAGQDCGACVLSVKGELTAVGQRARDVVGPRV